MKKLILSLSVAFLAYGINAQTVNHEISPEDSVKMYFEKGQAARASGDLATAADYFAKVNAIETAPYYKVKNKDTKKYEYYATKAEAEKAIAGGNYAKIKEGKITSSLLSTISAELNTEANNTLSLANQAFEAKDYAKAGKEFLNAYRLYKAIGSKNDVLKYYSAISLLQTDKKQNAAVLLESLVNEGFTGVQTNYFAVQNGQEVRFSSKADMDAQVKLGLATNPRTETTDSMEEELYSNATYAWYALENWDKALAFGQAGLEKYPDNDNMSQIVSGVYYKTGNSDKFIKRLEDKIASGTAKAVDYFNLAKTIEDTNGDTNKAKGYYEKSIETDPNFLESYINLAYIIIKPEEEFVKLMNANLGTSSKEKKIYTENMNARKDLYVEALPYFEKVYELDSERLEIIKALRNSYEIIGDDDKFFEFKALYESKAYNK